MEQSHIVYLCLLLVYICRAGIVSKKKQREMAKKKENKKTSRRKENGNSLLSCCEPREIVRAPAKFDDDGILLD